MATTNETPHEEYRGYILAPGVTMPSYDIYETEIFENLEQYRAGNPVHTSESDGEAKAWIDMQIELGEAGGVEEA